MTAPDSPEPKRGALHEVSRRPQEPAIGWRRRLYLTLRTEHTTPGKVASGVGVGVFVGCSPFWGFHFPLSVLLATVLRLNRMLVYTASNLVNPLTAPFVIFAEVQVGHRMLHGGWLALTLGELWSAGVGGLFLDFLIGGVIVGAAAGLALGLVAYAIARAGARPDDYQRLLDGVVRWYLSVSIHDAEAARRRLLKDPVYPFLLSEPSFAGARRVLDLGCGRGLAAAIALAAGYGHRGEREHVGVDLSERYVRVAREALGHVPGHTFVAADLRDFDPPTADVVLILNVLRFLPVSSQDALLRRLGKALHPGARVWIRELDAAGGWPFWLAAAWDLLSRFAPARARRPIGYRRASDIRNALIAAGFEVRDRTTLHGASRSRVLLEAVRRPAAVPRAGAPA